MTTRLAMDTGNFSYLCPDLFGIFRKSQRAQCVIVTAKSFEIYSKRSASTTPKI